MAKAENLRGSINYQDDSSLYLVSRDNSSYTITKMDKETLTETAKSSETMKGWPDFNYLESDGIIYSRYDGEKQSLTVLDASLKGKTFALDDGNYSYPISLGDGSLAVTFVSEDVQEVFDDEGNPVVPLVTIKDLGVVRFTTSAKTRIITSADLGFSSISEQGA